MKTNFCLIFTILFSAALPVCAQTGNYQREIAEDFENLSNIAPREIAYIQTSKDIYEKGEDLWFKVYLLNSITLSPSVLSRTLFIQLINEKTKKPAWQEKYEVREGFSDGRILLTNSMEEGTYLIEAFTSHSFFDDSAEFTSVRKIKIVNDIASVRYVGAKVSLISDSIILKLTPVFKQDTSEMEISVNLNQSGENTRILHEKIILTEDKEFKISTCSIDKVSSLIITTNHKGHNEEIILYVPGKSNPIQFNVFPEGGALVNGIKSRIAFKAVNVNGEPVDISGVLYKNDSVNLEFTSVHAGMGSFDLVPDDKAKYQIRLNEPYADSLYDFPMIMHEGITLSLLSRSKDDLTFQVSRIPNHAPEHIYLRVQARGLIYGITQAALVKDLRIKVPLADLPQGIAEITLFNNKFEPVAERLVYVNPEKKLKIHAFLSDSVVSTRGKVSLKIVTTDEFNKPVSANLGLTVFDRVYENQTDSINILTHMYLSSQLKGRIYNPGYYFNEKNAGRLNCLDLLLLTQGWRKYIWNERNLYKTGNSQIVTDGILGNTGSQSGFKKKKGNQQIVIIAFAPEKDSIKKIIAVDSSGFFLVRQELLKKWQGQYIYLKPFTSTKTTIKLEIINPFDSIVHVLNSKDLSIPVSSTIKEIIEPEMKIQKGGASIIKDVVIKGKGNRLVRGKYLGALDSIVAYNNTDYVCRYNILNCKNHPNEGDNRKPYEGEKVIIVSEGQMKEIIYHSSNYRPRTEEELLKLFNLYRIKGYYASKEFYQPNYDREYEYFSVPDFRNTLLWAPSVITNDKGEADFTFYSSDLNTNFTGRIEGVGGGSLLGTGYFKLSVRKIELAP